jgi:hypothetical protein
METCRAKGRLLLLQLYDAFGIGQRQAFGYWLIQLPAGRHRSAGVGCEFENRLRGGVGNSPAKCAPLTLPQASFFLESTGQ